MQPLPMSRSQIHFTVRMPWCSHAHVASHILGLLQNIHANGMMGGCCCRGTLQENPRRDFGATADKLKRGLQKEGLKKGRVQKLQEGGAAGGGSKGPPCRSALTPLHTRLCPASWADTQQSLHQA